MSSENSLRRLIGKIDQNASQDQVEKLRLLAAAVTGTISEGKGTFAIYDAIIDVLKEEANAVAVFRRLLTSAGYPRRFTEELSEFGPSQPTPDMDTLYFYELLVKVAGQVGNGEYFRYLRNRVPRSDLDIHREGIQSCVQLFQKLVMKTVLTPKPAKAAASLSKLEEWLKDINRNDVAEIVRQRIDELRESRDQPPAQGGIHPQEAEERLVQPVQETVTENR